MIFEFIIGVSKIVLIYSAFKFIYYWRVHRYPAKVVWEALDKYGFSFNRKDCTSILILNEQRRAADKRSKVSS